MWDVEYTDEFGRWFEQLDEGDQLAVITPRRTAILLIGGHKGDREPDTPDWNDWYDHAVRIADDLYDEYLDELRAEG